MRAVPHHHPHVPLPLDQPLILTQRLIEVVELGHDDPVASIVAHDRDLIILRTRQPDRRRVEFERRHVAT